MPYTTAGRNAIGTSGKAGLPYIGLMTDVNGTELAGGSYARVALALGAMSAGKCSNSGALAINVPAAGAPAALGIFDASTAGNLLGTFPLGDSTQYVDGVGVVDTIANDTILSRGHGLTTDDRVFFSAIMGESLPAGISATALYFVLASGLTTDAFKISTTSGGGALDITGLGEAAFWKTVPQVFASAGTVSYAIGQLVIDLTAI